MIRIAVEKNKEQLEKWGTDQVEKNSALAR